jgi:hypothetical protein
VRSCLAILWAALSIGLGGVLFGACRGAPGESPRDAATDPDDPDGFVCSVIAPTVCPNPPPHYPDIAPIVEVRCVPCHYGAVDGPWPLTSRKHLADWYDIIPPALLNCLMPPRDAGVPMTTEERVAILTWLRCGFPE